MSLLKEIMRNDKRAAEVLKQAELITDKDLKSVTRQDLHELFPGVQQLKRRRAIFDIIHKQKPVEKLLREMKEFIPDQSLRDALSNNGVLADYLQILKDMKSQMNNVQRFLDAHISLLEEYGPKQPDQKSTESTKPNPPKPCSGQSDCLQVPQDASDSGDQMMPSPGGHPQGGLGASAPATSGPVVFPQEENGEPFTILSSQEVAETTLVYQMVVAGKTFDAHQQVMDKVKEQVQIPIQPAKSDEDYQVTFVFCPISSRIASDVEAAMADVKGDKPVILVLMHHTWEVKYTTPMRTWKYDNRVLLHVNVFYHETQHGLLKCEQNNAAVSEIRNKLLERFISRSEVTGGNAEAVGADKATDKGGVLS